MIINIHIFLCCHCQVHYCRDWVEVYFVMDNYLFISHFLLLHKRTKLKNETRNGRDDVNVSSSMEWSGFIVPMYVERTNKQKHFQFK